MPNSDHNRLPTPLSPRANNFWHANPGKLLILKIRSPKYPEKITREFGDTPMKDPKSRLCRPEFSAYPDTKIPKLPHRSGPSHNPRMLA